MKSIKDASYSEWLVVNIQLGDTVALERLIRLWQERILLYGINKLQDSAAAQDALQECLISICKGIRSLHDPAAFPKWAFQIMDRRCQDQLRRIYKARAIQTALSEQADEFSIVEQPVDEGGERNLHKFLSSLPQALSQILRLHYLEEFSLSDIAEITGLPEGTVKSRLYYARKQLAALLED